MENEKLRSEIRENAYQTFCAGHTWRARAKRNIVMGGRRLKQNYQKMLEETIAKNQREERVPSLLLHSCCAPCSSYCLEYLSQYFKITVFIIIRIFIRRKNIQSVWRNSSILLSGFRQNIRFLCWREPMTKSAFMRWRAV